MSRGKSLGEEEPGRGLKYGSKLTMFIKQGKYDGSLKRISQNVEIGWFQKMII